jgi:hypothetical protein
MLFGNPSVTTNDKVIFPFDYILAGKIYLSNKHSSFFSDSGISFYLHKCTDQKRFCTPFVLVRYRGAFSDEQEQKHRSHRKHAIWLL